jgi:hypothetical protein
MNKAAKIKNDLRERFPRAVFSVRVRGDEVWVDRIGGHDYADELPTHQAAVREMSRVIQQTIPGFQWADYTKPDGKTVYRR